MQISFKVYSKFEHDFQKLMTNSGKLIIYHSVDAYIAAVDELSDE